MRPSTSQAGSCCSRCRAHAESLPLVHQTSACLGRHRKEWLDIVALDEPSSAVSPRQVLRSAREGVDEVDRPRQEPLAVLVSSSMVLTGVRLMASSLGDRPPLLRDGTPATRRAVGLSRDSVGEIDTVVYVGVQELLPQKLNGAIPGLSPSGFELQLVGPRSSPDWAGRRCREAAHRIRAPSGATRQLMFVSPTRALRLH